MHTIAKHASLTDEEMIRQVLPQQPHQCFESIYNRYVSKVYQQCLSITKDSEKAQDFTHDIFIKVFHKLEAFEQRASFSTWLHAISYNYCLDQLRVAKRLPLTPIDSILDQTQAESQEAQLQEETWQLVRRALETLSIQDQTLLRLKYEQGLSIEAIAQMYALKNSAVKMRLKRSREKIQQVYQALLVQ